MIKTFISTCAFICLFVLSSLALFQAENGPKFEQPLLITSAGQSAEVQLASVLAKRAELDFKLSKMATTEDLEGTKSVCLVIGVSLKGLGAAGLDMAQEKERVTALLTAAQEKGIPVLCLHLGGEQRRGQQTDMMIKEFLPYARMALVVKSGNKDSLFNSICETKGIPLIEVEKTVDALPPIKEAFN